MREEFLKPHITSGKISICCDRCGYESFVLEFSKHDDSNVDFIRKHTKRNVVSFMCCPKCGYSKKSNLFVELKGYESTTPEGFTCMKHFKLRDGEVPESLYKYLDLMFNKKEW